MFNKIEYNREHWSNYLDYTPYTRLTGLTPELTVEWIPGKPFVFDAFQLHATNKGTILKQKIQYQIEKENGQLENEIHKKNFRASWDIKMGLLLKFLREVK
jgi:hypothetical protein